MCASSMPSPETVKACMQDIVASSTFSRSGRLRAFLSYVVERELAGEAHLLKGYSIGIDVFQRPVDFDAGTDPLVRVQAGKLRKLLELYYESEGAAVPLRIRLPLGSYVPEYQWSKPTDYGSQGSARSEREKHTPRASWLPAPVSSPRALFTLLPLLLLAPFTNSDATIYSTSPAKLPGAGREFAHLPTETIPVLRIDQCWPATGSCSQLAEAIGNAAEYYQTIHLCPRLESRAGSPLSYSIRVEKANRGTAVYIRLIHEQSGQTILAEHVDAGALHDQESIAYEAVNYVARALSANGRIYQHAAHLGTATEMMKCLETSGSGDCLEATAHQIHKSALNRAPDEG